MYPLFDEIFRTEGLRILLAPDRRVQGRSMVWGEYLFPESLTDATVYASHSWSRNPALARFAEGVGRPSATPSKYRPSVGCLVVSW